MEIKMLPEGGMSLKLRIKPEGKLFVNGQGWIKNVGKRPMDVIVSDGINPRREGWKPKAERTTRENKGTEGTDDGPTLEPAQQAEGEPRHDRR